MSRMQAIREFDVDEPTIEASMRSLRQNLNQLRRKARELDQTALEDCLTLAISLTSPRRAND